MPITEYSVTCRVLRDTMDTTVERGYEQARTQTRLYTTSSRKLNQSYITVLQSRTAFILLRNRYFWYLLMSSQIT